MDPLVERVTSCSVGAVQERGHLFLFLSTPLPLAARRLGRVYNEVVHAHIPRARPAPFVMS